MTTARTDTHVVADEREFDYSALLIPSDLWWRVVHRYHGSATIRQGAAVVAGDCILETVGGPAPGPRSCLVGEPS
jgi:hypothetical protein